MRLSYCHNCGKQVNQVNNFCRECGCDLRVKDTEQSQPNESITTQKCARHPKMNAVGVCAQCGIGVCVVCKSGVKDKLYCPNCISDDVQHSSKAIGGLVKDKHIQHDLDWLQDFKKQYKEVVQLSLELQSIAKGIPLTPHEADNQVSSGIGEQFKELQIKFANLEKSLGGGPKPKSSDLGRMNRSLQQACVYFGVACVAYRKWAEQPSSSIEAYTTERLEKASKYIDKVNEQLALLSNKPAGVKNDAIREDLKTATSGNVETPSEDEEILKFKDVINGAGQPLKIQTTIVNIVLSCNKSISDAWPNFISYSPYQELEMQIRMELLVFFLHMTCRYAFAIGGPQFRANLQDALVESAIEDFIRRSLSSGEAPSGFDVDSFVANLRNALLKIYNKVEDDYGRCKRVGVEDDRDYLRKDTILGKLTNSINNCAGKKDNPSLRLHISTIVVESLAKSGLKEQVEELYRRGLELGADNTAVLDNRGNIVDGVEHYEEALIDYNRSLELHPDDPEVFYNRGNTLFDLERYEEALNDYNRSLELQPDDSEVLASRGDVLYELERFEEALRDYNRSLEISSDDTLTLEGRGDTLSELGRYEEALNDYNRLLELEPDNSDVLKNREVVLRKLKQHKLGRDTQSQESRYDKAAKNLKAAINKSQASPSDKAKMNIEVSVFTSTLSCNKSISDAWVDIFSQLPSDQSDFGIRAEMSFFFIHMTCMYAFEIGGPQFRANIQDQLVPSTFTRLIENSFNSSNVKPGFDQKRWVAKFTNEILGRYNEAESDYEDCVNEKTILGKLAERINRDHAGEECLPLRRHICAITAEALGKSGIKEQLEEIHRRELL